MKIATFNVNSLKARLPIVLDWLTAHQPDVLMLQEIKGLEIPEAEINAAGYQVQAVTQKTYNGAATLTKSPAVVIKTSILEGDEQARYLEVDYRGLRLINIYAPNGNPMGTEKFEYKLRWLECLYDRLAELRAARIPFLIAGDFNIIPEEIDAATPKSWENDALFQPQSRAFYRSFINLGLYDALRSINPSAGVYTFWDYQAGAWPRNNGIRIDHILLSPAVADRFINASVDRAPRALEKPSDHTPVLVELDDKIAL